MINIQNKRNCSGCHSCVNACHVKCISMVDDSEGFLYPVVDADKCINCGLCERCCPIINPNFADSDFNVEAFAAYTKNEQIRLSSSSGGVFNELASFVLEQQGVVFGPAFDKDMKLSHVCVTSIQGLATIRGSKYLQSTVGDSYVLAKKHLDDGKLVLFTGTPCQIGGLLSFLKKDYSNLFTQDLICHGVPSPMVWQKYVEFREKESGSSIKEVSFRDKRGGWKAFSMAMSFVDGTEYSKMFWHDMYHRAFLFDVSLRPSCYNCQFKGAERLSDLTVGDFWGIKNVIPQADDDKGISALFVNSAKGQFLFDNIKDRLVLYKVGCEDVIKYNPAMIKSVTKPSYRKKFFAILKADSIEAATRPLFKKPSAFKRGINQMKTLLKKLLKRG